MYIHRIRGCENTVFSSEELRFLAKQYSSYDKFIEALSFKFSEYNIYQKNYFLRRKIYKNLIKAYYWEKHIEISVLEHVMDNPDYKSFYEIDVQPIHNLKAAISHFKGILF